MAKADTAETKQTSGVMKLAWPALGILLAMSTHLLLQQYQRPAVLEDLPAPVQDLLRDLGLSEMVKSKNASRRQSLEEQLRSKLQAKHPLVFVPGIIACGLEIWKPGECYGPSMFRQRLWGGVGMAGAVMNFPCWLQHIALDPKTGLDPPGKEVRAAEGFHAADNFLPGYWLWAHVISAAAAVGYTPQTMHMACYDWRLNFKRLERRDRYYSRLRVQIETMVAESGEKAVLVGHSMGSAVLYHFMQWVSAHDASWVDRHVHAYVPVAGALLGAFGPLSAALSGEMMATANLGMLNTLVDHKMSFLNYTAQRDLYRTIGALGGLLPKGGSAVWGDADGPTATYARQGEEFDTDRIVEHLRNEIPDHAFMDYGEFGAAQPAAAKPDVVSSNPLASALPKAPNMTVYCLYGTGIPTERAYRYKGGDGAGDFGRIDYNFSDAIFRKGVATSDGDGTVPLVSLGYMCHSGWRDFRAFNPAGARTVVREYLDEPVPIWQDPRGGPRTGKHVEILGNSEIITDLLHIAAGKPEHLQEDRVTSELPIIARRISYKLADKLGVSL